MITSLSCGLSDNWRRAIKIYADLSQIFIMISSFLVLLPIKVLSSRPSLMISSHTARMTFQILIFVNCKSNPLRVLRRFLLIQPVLTFPSVRKGLPMWCPRLIHLRRKLVLRPDVLFVMEDIRKILVGPFILNLLPKSGALQIDLKFRSTVTGA